MVRVGPCHCIYMLRLGAVSLLRVCLGPSGSEPSRRHPYASVGFGSGSGSVRRIRTVARNRKQLRGKTIIIACICWYFGQPEPTRTLNPTQTPATTRLQGRCGRIRRFWRRFFCGATFWSLALRGLSQDKTSLWNVLEAGCLSRT